MQELRVTLDDVTYQQIIADAAVQGTDPSTWVTHAIRNALAGHPSRSKEFFIDEEGSGTAGAACFHLEMGGVRSQPDAAAVVKLQEQVRVLEQQRDELEELLSRKSAEAAVQEGLDREYYLLSCEIDKGSMKLDEMETRLEKLRIERESVNETPGEQSRLPGLDYQIRQKEYEIENFRHEVERLMDTRDALRKPKLSSRNGDLLTPR